MSARIVHKRCSILTIPPSISMSTKRPNAHVAVKDWHSGASPYQAGYPCAYAKHCILIGTNELSLIRSYRGNYAMLHGLNEP